MESANQEFVEGDDHSAESGDDQAGDRKRKAEDPQQQQQPRKQNKAMTASDGLEGVLISCDVHKEKRAVAEALNLFERLTDELLGVAPAPPPAAESVLDELEAELAAARAAASGRGTDRRWAVVPTGVRGMLLLALRPSAPRVDPVAIVRAAAQAAADTRGGTRLLQRLVPVARTCSGRLEALTECAKAVLLAGGLGKGCTPAVYAIEVRSRNNDGLGKGLVLKALRGLIPFPHLADTRNPQLLVLVEVFCRAASVAVVRAADYDRLRKFNLQELTLHGPLDPAAAAAAKDKKPKDPPKPAEPAPAPAPAIAPVAAAATVPAPVAPAAEPPAP